MSLAENIMSGSFLWPNYSQENGISHCLKRADSILLSLLCVLLTDIKEQVSADIRLRCAIWQCPQSPFVDFKRCHFLKTNTAIALVLACTVFEGKRDWTAVTCPSGNEKSLHSLHVIFHSPPFLPVRSKGD